MIKYELKRSKKPDGWMVMVGYDFKTVRSSALKSHLDDGWELIRKRYFIITYVSDWWKGLSIGNQISVIGIVLSTVLTLAFGLSNIHLSGENKYLIQKIDSLKQVISVRNLSIDSLTKEKNHLIERNNFLNDSIKKQIKYYKKPSSPKSKNNGKQTGT